MIRIPFVSDWFAKPEKVKPLQLDQVAPQRMQLSDFRFADKQAAGTIMQIPLPNGHDSGEWLRVLGPYCDDGVKAAREYARAYTALREELKPLDDECAVGQDWTRYNSEMNWRADDLNEKLAAAVVIGWSFDDEFSMYAVVELMRQYKGLATYVAQHFHESRKALLEK